MDLIKTELNIEHKNLNALMVDFFGFEELVVSNDTLAATDLIRRRWLDNDFYGLTFSLSIHFSAPFLSTALMPFTFHDIKVRFAI